MTTIHVTKGAKEYVGGTITEKTGANIQAATYSIGLSASSQTPPVSFSTPAVSEQGATVADRVVKLLVDNATAPGTWYCWVKVSDIPEVALRMIHGPIKVI